MTAGAILPPTGLSRKPETRESIKMIDFDTAGNIEEGTAASQ